ncbi:hypothetical protein DUI87_13034 [Hirundo rustica rustica]|uniref:Uncharacterized protein n=1 Tax=Hirundo rustica rustica TaxID=333673 RepID=A0A3M0KAS3_HIRRU|nr:hypothetical protein DUI87_13034 [Hirundo rustica rustica]
MNSAEDSETDTNAIEYSLSQNLEKATSFRFKPSTTPVQLSCIQREGAHDEDAHIKYWFRTTAAKITASDDYPLRVITSSYDFILAPNRQIPKQYERMLKCPLSPVGNACLMKLGLKGQGGTK